MTYHTNIVGNKQDVGCDWTGRSYDAPEREPGTLVSDHECARRQIDAVTARGRGFLHCLQIVEVVAKNGTPRKEIYRRARREYNRNRRMLQSGLVRYETLDERPATVRIAPVASPSRRPSGHAPRAHRHSTRSTAASGSSGESDDGGSDSSDSSDGPASLPLIGGNLRNEFHSELSHKQENNINIDLLDRLTLASAGLLAAVVASLILTGCSL